MALIRPGQAGLVRTESRSPARGHAVIEKKCSTRAGRLAFTCGLGLRVGTAILLRLAARGTSILACKWTRVLCGGIMPVPVMMWSMCFDYAESLLFCVIVVGSERSASAAQAPTRTASAAVTQAAAVAAVIGLSKLSS